MKASMLCLAASAVGVSGRLRIALYGGEGAILGDKDYPYLDTIEAAGLALDAEASVTVLLEEGVRQNLTTEHFDAVVFPGGWGSGQAEGLGAKGLAVVRSFVAAGGGYIGTCAGAFLALKDLRLYGDGPTDEGIPADSLGEGTSQVELAEQGFEELGLDRDDFAGNVTIFYEGGPVVAAAALPASVSVLAWYRSALPSWDPEPQGVGTPAVTSTAYGAGRVVLNSPHPAHTLSQGIGPAFYQGELAWVLRRDAHRVARCCYAADCSDCESEADSCSASVASCGDCSGTLQLCAPETLAVAASVAV